MTQRICTYLAAVAYLPSNLHRGYGLREQFRIARLAAKLNERWTA